MTNDKSLVSRLRAMPEWLENVKEAADEIERLQHDIDKALANHSADLSSSDEPGRAAMTLKRVSVYGVDDGDGHTDQMDGYDPSGEFYYVEDVDKHVLNFKAEIERMTSLLKSSAEHAEQHSWKCGLNPNPYAAKHMVSHCTCQPVPKP